MKYRIFSLFIIVVVLLMGVSPETARADAYGIQYSSIIAYMNVGTAATTTLSLSFYATPTTTTPVVVTLPNLNPNAATIVLVASLISGSFQGTAVMSSNQPMKAVIIEVPPSGSASMNQLLSAGYDLGSSTALIATVLKNQFNANTIVAVQNTGGISTSATFKFYNTSATLVHQFSQTLNPGAGYFADVNTIAGVTAPFNGSLVIQAGSGGSIVASANELNINGYNGASAFESVPQGARKYYMPTALCDAFGGAQRTSYAVQNTNLTTSTNVTVTFSPGGHTQTKAVGPGAKASFPACQVPGISPGSGYSGSAIVDSDTTDIIAMGKAFDNTGGMYTAFVGVPVGASKLYLPHVRWGTTNDYDNGLELRTFIAVQNIGSSTLAAGAVTAKYYDRNGTLVATHTLGALAPLAKLNTNPGLAGLNEFGIYHPGYGGSVVIEGPSGSQLAALARVGSFTTIKWYEDYIALKP